MFALNPLFQAEKRKRKYAVVNISSASGYLNQPPKFKTHFGRTGFAVMATKEKPTRRLQKNINKTFEVSSIDSSAVEEKLFGRADKDVEDDDGPVVFICGKCRLPIGDSMSWDGSEDDQNQIKLKRVTNNVIIGKDTHFLEMNKQSACLVVDLICRSCYSLLGMVYTSTPRNLDHKRSTFCLSVASIDSYVLGSGGQMLAAEGPKEQLVTLEYRHNVEQQLAEMKMLVVSMAQRLEEIEAGLKEECDEA
ncbi:protein Mis18-alpha [Poecilia formosa]|uniref:Protein Mis18-alpha n=3 Tax=Poecilia TaxID=8080 RepID=A0A087YGJ8_POEFO|nr:PREDICTED: protein Mis18-alpha [Poecilia formosa]